MGYFILVIAYGGECLITAKERAEDKAKAEEISNTIANLNKRTPGMDTNDTDCTNVLEQVQTEENKAENPSNTHRFKI